MSLSSYWQHNQDDMQLQRLDITVELGTLWSLVHLSLFRSNCAGSPDPLASQSWPFRIWPEEDQLPNMDVSEEGLQPSYPS